jgi:hypothetical protein
VGTIVALNVVMVGEGFKVCCDVSFVGGDYFPIDRIGPMPRSRYNPPFLLPNLNLLRYIERWFTTDFV